MHKYRTELVMAARYSTVETDSILCHQVAVVNLTPLPSSSSSLFSHFLSSPSYLLAGLKWTESLPCHTELPCSASLVSPQPPSELSQVVIISPPFYRSLKWDVKRLPKVIKKNSKGEIQIQKAVSRASLLPSHPERSWNTPFSVCGIVLLPEHFLRKSSHQWLYT